VLTDADIARCAELMVGLYGEDAGARAALRASELFAARQAGAGSIWLAVKAAIEQLSGPASRSG
jgi:hypothetical protein